ncbi:hypothetical protein AJ80_06008 [Polytolypa hystricis UAMH7299]|uniref:Arf-GAP domain-containing protein n=1 Tax=Polytolypa hystricis (strain UAMH7299) TaxID=1447883 RepID=A0A2B7Y0D4_POLH7|nr:hypothetical protein AJ80_06008 [Polytolypa hystricis UAMH7299]
MSRRVTADRAAQNQQTIRNILKLESNKTCADCKRNKHPRWASWNLGVFVCIRCSGVHRGMGTHISRVKSVDLDSWTDEQLQSVLKWGNARANKYWEAKLAAGHVPSESKIENFIRTKYETKRWVMDGPMPDPATLDTEGDEDVPLAVVQEKAKLERSASQRVSSTVRQPAARRQPQAPVNLFDDDTPSPPARPNTTDISGAHGPARPPPAPAPKQAKPADSLLGLDFFGSAQPATNRPSSTPSATAASAAPSRPDLKQSILSLYASTPKQQSPPQHDRNTSFGSLSSMSSPPQPKPDAFGGLTDAFSGLSFPSTTTSPPPVQKPSAFSNLDAFSSIKSPPTTSAAFTSTVAAPLGGSASLFNDSFSSAPKPQAAKKPSISSGTGSFNIMEATMGSTKSTAAPPTTSSSAMFDLFSAPNSTKRTNTTSPPPAAPKNADMNSIFNLSAPAPPAAKPAPTTTTAASVASMIPPSIDPWGGNAWASSDPSPPPLSAPAPAPTRATHAPTTTTTTSAASMMMKLPDTLTANDIGSGWGASSTTSSKPAPTVSADEDFGGWTSAAPASSGTGGVTSGSTGGSGNAGGKGFGGSEDLFGNVWE